MKRHWPLILGILLVLGAAAAYRFRGAAASSPELRPGSGTPAGETPREASTPVQEVSPKPSTETPDLKQPAKLPMGSLRVVLQGAGFLNGQVVVLGVDDYPDSSLEVSGSDRVEVLAEKLRPGPKRVVYVSQRSYLPVSADATVEADRVGEVLLALKESGTLRGTVVDSLQRPFVGVTVEVAVPAVFATRNTGKSPTSVWNQGLSRKGGAAGGSVRSPVHYSRSLWSDGRLVVSVTSNDEGQVELTGIPGGAAQVVVRYKDLTFTQACLPDVENLFIVPALPEAPIIDPKAEALQKAVQALLKEMAIHHDNPEPYAAQLRELLHQNLAESSLPEKEKVEIRKRIESIGRPEPKR